MMLVMYFLIWTALSLDKTCQIGKKNTFFYPPNVLQLSVLVFYFLLYQFAASAATPHVLAMLLWVLLIFLILCDI